MPKIKAKVQSALQAVFKFTPSTKFILIFSWIWALVCLVGLFIVPSSEFAKKLRPDENALLLRSSYLYYSDHHVDIAHSHAENLNKLPPTSSAKISYLEDTFTRLNIKFSTQPFEYSLPLETKPTVGTNFYGILRAPRGDGTEALILSADWLSLNTTEPNHNGVALLLSLAELFSESAYWAKDVILLITDGGLPATNAWLSAYHKSQPPPGISKLSLRSGAIQLAVDINLPGLKTSYSSFEFYYGGVNGVLPNQDLITSLVECSRMFEVFTSYVGTAPGSYWSQLRTSSKQLLRQASCAPSSPQGLFLAYDVDAITVRGVTTSGEKLGFRQFGQITECLFRSLNNLLERLHHATRFYLMIGPSRFIPLGIYLPLALAISLLSLIVPVLHLKKLKNETLPENNDKSNTKGDLYIDSPRYPSIQFQSGWRGPALYLTCVFVSLISERVASHGLYRLPQPLNQLGWLVFVAISSAIGSHVLCRLSHHQDGASHEAKLLALAFSGIGASFLASINAGLSLLLGLATLPYTLVLLPRLLPQSFTIFASPFLWPIWYSTALTLTQYDINQLSTICLETFSQILKELFVTRDLFGGWLIPAVVLIYLPLQLSFLLP